MSEQQDLEKIGSALFQYFESDKSIRKKEIWITGDEVVSGQCQRKSSFKKS